MSTEKKDQMWTTERQPLHHIDKNGFSDERKEKQGLHLTYWKTVWPDTIYALIFASLMNSKLLILSPCCHMFSEGQHMFNSYIRHRHILTNTGMSNEQPTCMALTYSYSTYKHNTLRQTHTHTHSDNHHPPPDPTTPAPVCTSVTAASNTAVNPPRPISAQALLWLVDVHTNSHRHTHMHTRIHTLRYQMTKYPDWQSTGHFLSCLPWGQHVSVTLWLQTGLMSDGKNDQ